MPIPRHEVAKAIAYLPGVKAAVRATRDKLAAEADLVFAGHDRPGRHEITKQNEKLDALVSLEGPAPLSVEFGHFAGPRTEPDRKFVPGLHVLGKAVTAMEAAHR